MELDDFLDKYFGALPLTKSHCELFYYLAMLIVFVGAFAIGGSLYTVYLKRNEKGKAFAFFSMLSVSFMALMYWYVYYLYRILYSMCIRTVKD